MITFQLLLFSLLLPALISGVVFFVAWRGWQPSAASPNGTWGGPTAIGFGYVVGHVGTIGFPPFPAIEATQWLLYFGFAGILLGLLESRSRGHTLVRWGGRLLFSGFIPWLLLHATLKYRWGTIEGMMWVVGLGALTLVFFLVLDTLTGRLSGVSSPLILLIVTLGSSVVLVLSGSALLGQLAGILASALGASLITAWWQPKLIPRLDRDVRFAPLAGEGVTVVAVLLVGLWLNGYFYAEVPATSALLLGTAPAAAWIRWLAPVQRLEGWRATFVSVVTVLVPVVLAVALALRASPPIEYDY